MHITPACRLYILRNARTREPVLFRGELEAYPSKGLAKPGRDSLAALTGEDFVVSYGPDHKHWRG